MHIPYSKRHWKDDGCEFFYIQPFADHFLPTQFVELILDNNAFIKATKDVTPYLAAAIIPEIVGCGVNPWPALIEQWVSNPDFFWANSGKASGETTSPLLFDFLKVSKALQVKFPTDYIRQRLIDLEKNEAYFRRQLGILFAYIAVIRSIQKRKLPLDVKFEKLEEFTSQDIPIFNGLICLAVLTFYAQANRLLLIDNHTQLISSIESFYQPKNKEENFITANYLRNRAADLWIWYFMASMYQGKSMSKILEGGTPIIVTADKFVASIPFRFIPPTIQKTGSGTHFEFHFSPDGLPFEHQNKLMDLCNSSCKAIPSKLDGFEQEKKLENMFQHTMKMLDDKDKVGFKDAWEMWVATNKRSQ